MHFRHAGFLALHVQDAFVLASANRLPAAATSQCMVSMQDGDGNQSLLGYCKIKTCGAASAASVFLFEVNLAPKGLSRQGFMSALQCHNDGFRRASNSYQR